MRPYNYSLAGSSGVVALTMLLAWCNVGTPSTYAAPPPKGGIAGYRHVFIIVMENESYGQIIGNSQAPRLNALARTYGLATNYYGVSHPSEPNYVAMIGGSDFGIQDDNGYTSHTINQPSVASQLDAKGLTWKSYQEALPSPGYLGTVYPSAVQPLYASKHDPFLNFASVQHNKADLRKIVPLTQLTSDLSSGRVPSLSYIVPNQCDDMHGGLLACPFSNLISVGDSVAGQLVTAITSTSVWAKGNNTIVIVWDENDGASSGVTGCCAANPGGGHVAAIVVTNHGPRHVRDGTPYNHYSLLRTVQVAFGLGCLQHTCDQAIKPMTSLFAV